MASGGGGGFPQQASPQEEAEAQLMLERERALIQQQQADRERELAEAKRQEDLTRFNTQLDDATAFARDRATGRLSDLGLDPTNFQDQLEQALGSVRRTVPELNSNPFGFYENRNFAQEIFDTETTNRRNSARTDFRQFAGDGFAANRLNDTLDDNIIEQILSDRFEPAAEFLNNARLRGQLDDGGHTNALAQLQEQRKAGSGRLQDIGLGVLNTGREQLRGIADEGFSAIDNILASDNPFDANPFKQRIDQRATDFTSGLRGSLETALGGEKLFNPDQLVQRIGGGLSNRPDRSPSLLSALQDRQQDRSQERGLGEQGQF